MSLPIPNPAFEEASTLALEDDSGESVVIRVTRRIATGHHSFSISKVYRRADGSIASSNFLSRRHLAILRKLIDQVEQHLDEAEKTPLKRAAVRSR